MGVGAHRWGLQRPLLSDTKVFKHSRVVWSPSDRTPSVGGAVAELDILHGPSRIIFLCWRHVVEQLKYVLRGRRYRIANE